MTSIAQLVVRCDFKNGHQNDICHQATKHHLLAAHVGCQVDFSPIRILLVPRALKT